MNISLAKFLTDASLILMMGCVSTMYLLDLNAIEAIKAIIALIS